MPKYQYSVIRFVPSPIRAEFVNVGLILGSDQTGEWLIDVVSSKNRASKLDDENVLPMVTAELQRLQTSIERFTEPDLLQPEVNISEEWLRDLGRNSQGSLQFSGPRPVLAESVASAYEKLWSKLIFEHVPATRTSVSKATVISKYWEALLGRNLGSRNVKKRVRLQVGRTHAPIDVVVHNGVVKDVTQCWSLQVKNSEEVLNDIKAWGWTIRNLRETGGTVRSGSENIAVPNNVSVGVIYAPSEDSNLMQEALGVFQDGIVHAEAVSIERADTHAQTAWQALQESISD